MSKPLSLADLRKGYDRLRTKYFLDALPPLHVPPPAKDLQWGWLPDNTDAVGETFFDEDGDPFLIRLKRRYNDRWWAGVWVVAFLVAYLVKRLALGDEDLRIWSSAARTNLYVHEGFVAAMLIAGLVALALGRRLAKTRRVTQSASDPLAPREVLSRHRLAGRIALVAALFGLLTACGILGGMLARA